MIITSICGRELLIPIELTMYGAEDVHVLRNDDFGIREIVDTLDETRKVIEARLNTYLVADNQLSPKGKRIKRRILKHLGE